MKLKFIYFPIIIYYLHKMKKILTTTIGSYPRPSWFAEYLRAIEGKQKDYYSKIDEKSYEKAVYEVLNEQKNIDIPTDGQLIWQDFLLFLATKLEGFKMGGLIRYFDNNVYFRKPEIVGKIERKDEIVIEEYKIARSINVNVKPVLSLYTIIKSSKNTFYKNNRDALFDLADALHKEILMLEKLGAKNIQFNEPSLCFASKEEMDDVCEAYKIVTKDIKAKIWIVTYFGSVSPQIFDFPVDVIGLDFVEGFEENLKNLQNGLNKKELCVGMIDGRTTKMENLVEVKKKLAEISNVANISYISPNTGLEFLPWIKAKEKLKILEKLKN